MHCVSSDECTDGSFSEEQKLDSVWTSDDNSPPRFPLPHNHQDTIRDTAPGSEDHTPRHHAPRDAPEISVTPPCDSPTIYRPQHEPDSPFQLGADLMSLEICQMLSRSRSRSQFTRQDERDRTSTRARSDSQSRASTSHRNSPSPRIANRRHGMIDIAGFNNDFSGQLLSQSLTYTGGRVEDAGTGEEWESQPDSELNGSDSEFAHDTFDKPSDLPYINYHTEFSEAERLYGFPEKDIEDVQDTTSVGKWRCCECRRGYQTYHMNSGDHLISILNCSCTHRSCRNCTFEGSVKRFAPIYDPAGLASVPILEGNNKPIQFGVVCRTCGLSWRAKKTEAPKRHRSFRQRLSVLPKKVNPLHKLRHTRSMIHLGLSDDHNDDSRPGTALSASRSVFNLRCASDSQTKRTSPGEQAPGVEVRFYGIECTCGSVTNSGSLCFQLVEKPKAEGKPAHMEQMGMEAREASETTLAPALRAKGYGTPMLSLKGGSHPNPLLSNPAQAFEVL